MRKNEKEASRKYVGEENGRSKSQWKEEKIGRSRDFVEEGRERRKHHRKESRNKSQLRQREPGASRNCEENERSKSQWRRQEKGDGGTPGSLLRRSPLHGMGDGKEGSTHHKRQSRSDSQLAQQEQEDGWRRRGLVGSPLHGRGEAWGLAIVASYGGALLYCSRSSRLRLAVRGRREKGKDKD